MSEENKQDYSIEFSYKNCTIYKYTYNKRLESGNLTPPKLRFIDSWNEEDETVSIRYELQFPKEKGSEEWLAEIDVEHIFKIIDIRQFKVDAHALRLPDQFWIALYSISWSTTRGILIGKGAGTLLEEYPLPLIEPSTLLEIKKSLPRQEELMAVDE